MVEFSIWRHENLGCDGNPMISTRDGKTCEQHNPAKRTLFRKLYAIWINVGNLNDLMAVCSGTLYFQKFLFSWIMYVLEKLKFCILSSGIESSEFYTLFYGTLNLPVIIGVTYLDRQVMLFCSILKCVTIYAF